MAIDQLFTGKVERVDVELLQTLLNQGIVPVVPPLGFDGEGKTYRAQLRQHRGRGGRSPESRQS